MASWARLEAHQADESCAEAWERLVLDRGADAVLGQRSDVVLACVEQHGCCPALRSEQWQRWCSTQKTPGHHRLAKSRCTTSRYWMAEPATTG